MKTIATPTPIAMPIATQIALKKRAARPRPSRRKQRGVAALEFALVFPVVFLLVYGMITFGLILVAQQSLTLAVGEGARAALRYNNDPVSAACAAVNQSASWLSTNLMNCTAGASNAAAVISCPYLSTSSCLKVTATYPYAAQPLVPTLPFLGIVLPTVLTASTTVQLEPNLATQ